MATHGCDHFAGSIIQFCADGTDAIINDFSKHPLKIYSGYFQ